MAIKRRKIDNGIERQIAIAMITSNQFLSEIQPIYKRELLEIPYCQLIAKWCLGYFDKYEKAPSKHIQDIFNKEVKRGIDSEYEDLIEEFLDSLSQEYTESETLNIDYLLQEAENRFASQDIKNLTKDILQEVENNNVTEAKAILARYSPVELPKSEAINPFDNEEKLREAFENEDEVLFKLPGALGKFTEGQFCRESLISIQAPEKRGKTWWQMFFALTASSQRNNVAFFQVGDMSEGQMIKRQAIYLAKRSNKKKYCSRTLIPTMDCWHNQTDSCDMDERTCDVGVVFGTKESRKYISFDDAEGYEPCVECRKDNPKEFRGAVWYKERDRVDPLTWKQSLKYMQKQKKRMGKKQFKLSTHPNSTINIRGIKSQLDIWERYDGFIPDVIIIDYADILAPEDNRQDKRDQVNETWKALRRLSQERKCCVISATQADADSYDKKSQNLKNFSEDKRKYAHVTLSLALNQTPQEKERGIMRIGSLLAREDDFSLLQEVKVLQCLQIGRPYLDSYL